MNQVSNHSKRPTEDSERSGIPVNLVQFLVVDDYAIVRRIVGEGLKACGAKNIHGVQDGREAISFLKLRSPSIRDNVLLEMMDARPDIARDLSPEGPNFKISHSTCVITDFSMEGSNGLEVLKAIRCGETNVPRDTPVILLTGYSDDFVIAAALELDVSAFIVKPVSQNTLQDRLNRVLKSAIQLKSVRAYADVKIPNEKGECLSDGVVAGPSKTAADEDEETRWLPIMAIQPGAVLAEDLRTERGALLMKAGTVLSSFVIQRLRDVADSDGLHGNIPIKNCPKPH